MANGGGGTVYWRIGALEQEVKALRQTLDQMRQVEQEAIQARLRVERERREHEAQTRKLDRRAIWASASLIIAALIAATATLLTQIG